ncbi:MAG: hypothetical protein K2Y08_07355 [Alphaproteobacteria bacterium]|nr:hypothetical protein [Alphaproteobacteria bacterium]
MKNLALVTILIGLSGTALFATVDTTGLPSELQTQIKAAEQNVSSGANPLQTFVTQSTNSLNELYTQKNQLLKEKGYLKGNPVLNLVDQTLSETKKNITTLSQAENAYSTVSSNLAGLPLLLAYLNTITPSTNFPDSCATYNGTKVTGGVVKYSPTRVYRFYYDNLEKSYGFLSEITDVGLINSGSEYTVGATPGGQVQDGYLGTDPITKQQVIVCLSNPYSSSATTKSTTSSAAEAKPATTETKK